mmetsp:Transcript_22164/g.46626  ORF Transcript_22164/g.46626 Transcript_22164/m.46626 type:complete len:232 (+) Transcript_22164:22-717(+)
MKAAKTLLVSALSLATGTAAFSSTTLIPGEIDVSNAYSQSTFPISPPDLVSRAKQVLSAEIELGTKDNGACLADDFEFVAAVVGPINKEEFLNALGSFKLTESFDIDQNLFGFTVDSIQTNRVWYFSRQIAKQIAPFMGTKPEDLKEDLTLPPQLHHIDFDESGLVKEFGFYTVDRRQGNTGGLGGAFGYFYGVGKPLPIPECKPYKPSLRFRMLNLLGKLGRKLSKNKSA